MTADIGSQVYCDEAEAKRRDLATRDLLGACAAATTTATTRSTEELHLDLRIPYCWESLLSGEIYPRKSNPDPIHDLSLSPPPPPPPAFDHQCTLEKVRSALERARREEPGSTRRSADGSPSASSSSSTSSSSKRRRAAGEVSRGGAGSSSGSLTAAGCSECLTYVLISSSNPRCPRCDSRVPVPPATAKKPRVDCMKMTDLNLTSPWNSH